MRRARPASSSASSSSTGARRARRTSTASARSAATCCMAAPAPLLAARRPSAVRAPSISTDYSINAVACLEEQVRFPRHAQSATRRSADIDYAYHFDASLLRARSCAARRKRARRARASRARSSTCISTPKSGFVESVTLDRRTRGRGRPVHRLLRLPRAADRATR